VKGLVRRLSLFAIACACVAGCRGPAGPAITGNWSGFLYLHDEYGAPLANDSGVTVALTPSSTIDTSVTAGAGSYGFTSVTVGVYSLQYTAPGMGTYIVANQQFVGGGTVNIPGLNLGMKSAGTITGLAMTVNPTHDTIYVTGSIGAPPAGVSRYVRLFYGSTSGVTSAPGAWTATGPSTGDHPYAVSTAAFTIPITGQDLLALEAVFGSGKTVNAVAYGESYYENSYPDQTTGKPHFPNVAPTASNTTTVVLP
jgi:hypothetical protein